MKKELEKEFEALWETDFGGKHFDVFTDHNVCSRYDVSAVEFDALSEEPDKDLEEAAKQNADGLWRLCDWQPNWDDLYESFIAGAEWQKEQMMKDGNVILAEEDFDAEKEKSMEWGYNLCKEQMPLPEDTLIFRKGVEEGRRLEREDTMTNLSYNELMELYKNIRDEIRRREEKK